MDDNNDIRESMEFSNDSSPAIIKVIGVGGGGSNAVNYMYRQNIPHVKFVITNTDKQHLEKSEVPEKLILGYDIKHGGGAGNDPAVGRACAEATEDEIRKLFTDETEMVFITAGMGGGTGTGAGPVIARLAKEAGMLTIGIITVPFLFEGKKKIIKALNGAKEMQKYVDALLMINNDNLIELYRDLNFFNAFGKADETLANAARSISEIISEECYINVDFQDVKTTLKDSGTAIIATAIGEGEHRVSNAIHNALHSPLLKAHDVNTSKRLLLKFTCSKDDANAISMGEMAEIRQFTDKLPSSIDVKWGIGDDPSLGDKVKVTVLASGFDVTLSEGARPDGGKNKGDVITFKPDSPAEEENSPLVENPEETIMVDVYGAEKLYRQNREAAKIKYVVLKPSQLDDHDIIDLITRVPSLNRDQRFYEELQRLSQPGGHLRPQPRPQKDSGSEGNAPGTITF